jgi:hypothetical protein
MSRRTPLASIRHVPPAYCPGAQAVPPPRHSGCQAAIAWPALYQMLSPRQAEAQRCAVTTETSTRGGGRARSVTSNRPTATYGAVPRCDALDGPAVRAGAGGRAARQLDGTRTSETTASKPSASIRDFARSTSRHVTSGIERWSPSEMFAIVAAAAPRLRRTAYLMCRDWHLAQELTQITVSKMYASWDRISRTTNLEAYSRQILMNAVFGSEEAAQRLGNRARRLPESSERLSDSTTDAGTSTAGRAVPDANATGSSESRRTPTSAGGTAAAIAPPAPPGRRVREPGGAPVGAGRPPGGGAPVFPRLWIRHRERAGSAFAGSGAGAGTPAMRSWPRA